MPGHEAGRRPRKRYSVSPHALAGKIIVGIHVGVDGVAFADILAGHGPFRALIADVIHMADRSAARGVEFLSGQLMMLGAASDGAFTAAPPGFRIRGWPAQIRADSTTLSQNSN